MTKQLPGERLEDVIQRDAYTGGLFVNEPMKDHTTLRIGGSAEIYAEPKDTGSMKNLLSALLEDDIASMPLGGGSNLLVSDEGIEGAVISTASLDHMRVIEEDAYSARVFAEAGVPLGRLINLSRDKGYRGVEGLTGIPGSLGGAILGNAGSFGFSIGDVVESVTGMDRNGKTLHIKKDDISFGYRASGIPEGVIVLSAEMRFQKDDIQNVIKRVSDFNREKMTKHPIAQFSAGCVFKNPAGNHAGKLIDHSGCKGMSRGDIEVSDLHANYFINKGNGKACDFLALMEDVRERVMKSFGIELEPEIKIVGRKDRG
ncbi:MAG TPA: UDP-N-acetylmuramate dehydrogenase [Thermodesulfovibrionales bacterium]|nr:UDP-N-acetylmuramate dehydrogenase [Thermodesulfovibrionales bacterium]